MHLQLPAPSPSRQHGDPASIAQRWKKWKKRFEYFLQTSGITNDNRKLALILHIEGPDTQDIFETLTYTSWHRISACIKQIRLTLLY